MNDGCQVDISSRTPTIIVTKSQISLRQRKRIDRVIENIINLPECTFTARSSFWARILDFKFNLSRPDNSYRGLIGGESNRELYQERSIFQQGCGLLIVSQQVERCRPTDGRKGICFI